MGKSIDTERRKGGDHLGLEVWEGTGEGRGQQLPKSLGFLYG